MYKNTDDNWSDYWNVEGKHGEVFVNKQGDKHRDLVDFWSRKFESVTEAKTIIDLACGGGSIFSDISAANRFELFGLDISLQALSKLNQRISTVNCINSGLNPIAVQSGVFDFVVSQFGIEYAGPEAFFEAFRLLKSGGQYIGITHIKDGLIDNKNQISSQGVKLVNDIQFIELAIRLVKTLYQDNESDFEKAAKEFTAVEPLLAAYAQKYDYGVHAHLYKGAKELISRYQAYDEKQIIDWLQSMGDEVRKLDIRLRGMTQAALSKITMDSITSELSELGAVDVVCEPFYLTNYDKPVAWRLEYTKV